MNRHTPVASRSNAIPMISNSDLFMKSLRLLHIDEDFDWPDIRTSTFSSTDSVKNQNSRVYKTAWVYYKLFELYEPQKTKRDWKHLFPPLETKQLSLLRSAVFKRLYELKASGYLAKDVVLRKTMFEDCKGPKFEELLAVFSSAVLIRVMESDASDRSVVKAALRKPHMHLDTASLILVYKVSLSMQLQSRQLLERRWMKFSRTLETQEGLLKQRAQLINSRPRTSSKKRIPRRTLTRLRQYLLEHWNGDSEWVDILLKSDQHRPTGLLLETPYSKVWQHACDDTLYAIRPHSNHSRLQVLENRVEEQRTRLEKWKSSLATISASRRVPRVVSETVADQTSIPVKRYSLRPSTYQSEERQTIIHRNAGESKVPTSEAQRTRHRRSRSAVEVVKPKEPSLDLVYKKEIPKPMANTGIKVSSTSQSSRPHTSYSSSSHLPARVQSVETVDKSFVMSDDQSLSGTATTEDISEDFSNDSIEAANILSSVLDTRMSSSRAPLSLGERTRMSMATMGVRQNVDTAPRPYQNLPTAIEPAPSTPNVGLSDLAERTRKSMITRNPIAYGPRRTSRSRSSVVHPTNPFERTSAQEIPEESVFDETTINLDEEDIFKSRPKVALSPVLSPMTGNEFVPLVRMMQEDDSYEDDFS